MVRKIKNYCIGFLGILILVAVVGCSFKIDRERFILKNPIEKKKMKKTDIEDLDKTFIPPPNDVSKKTQ